MKDIEKLIWTGEGSNWGNAIEMIVKKQREMIDRINKISQMLIESPEMPKKIRDKAQEELTYINNDMRKLRG